VIILGPSHRVALRGIAIPTDDAFATPLGIVPIDREARTRVVALGSVIAHDAPHAYEHSIEVQVPFLQRALDRFTVLPLAVGHCGIDDVESVLDAVWGGPETLIVVSTDLSHYHRYEDAVRLDRRTTDAIRRLEADDIADLDACGAYPLRGLLVVARRRGMRADVLDLRNSGDTAGDKDRVVGYAAVSVR
jgi:AmmeMemoRadiSam system protein B